MAKKVIDKLMLNGVAYQTAYDSDIKIQLNWADTGVTNGTFNTNQSSGQTINIAVTKSTVWLSNVDNTSDANKPISTATQAALDDKQDTLTPWTWITITNNTIATTALPWTTKYWASLDLSMNTTTYVVTAQLKDQDGNNLWTAKTIDLPLETVVVSGSYDSATKKVILTLKDGSTIEFSVADLIDWLQSEITSTNKLDADLVDDSTSTNKFVTASNKNTWNAKQDALESGTNIKTINNQSILGSWNLNIAWWVTSVNTKTWAVVLDADDIDDTSTTNKWTNDAEKASWDAKAETSDIKNWVTTFSQWGVSLWTTSANQAGNWTINIHDNIPKTQAEYNALPASKTSDWNTYLIYTSIA